MPALPPDKVTKLEKAKASIDSISAALHGMKVKIEFARRARKYQSFRCDYGVSKILAELAKIEESYYK